MSRRLLVLYGSQTGTAQDVAEQVWRESKRFGFTGPVLSLDELSLEKFIDEEHLIVFVIATTGDGDEPDNMKRTWKFLLRRNLPSNLLEHMNFACLGLGDSGYAKFNYAAKKLFKRLQQLGAHPLLPLALGDDQHDRGWAAEVLPWMKNLWKLLMERMGVTESGDKRQDAAIFKWQVDRLEATENLVSDATLCQTQWMTRDGLTNAIEFTLTRNERTTAVDHFQDVRLISFTYPSGVVWQPGDVLRLRPYNSLAVVKQFWTLAAEYKWNFDNTTTLRVSSAHTDMPVPAIFTSHIISVDQLVTYIWDLTALPRRRVFELLALNCSDELESDKLEEFCSADGVDDLIAYAHRPRRNILEVLADFPKAASHLTLPILMELFAPIQPRSYSIASANQHLDLLIAVVEYRTIMSTPRLGLCTNWLRTLQPGTVIYAEIKKGTLRLPADPKVPLIMVGPGTGIAPFRSVVQNQLTLQENGGRLIIFFGCRNHDKDCHFADDYKRWQQQSSESRCVQVFIAYSRDQSNKIYVQHLIRQQAELLRPLIRAGEACILVAGAANSMPKAVREAFSKIIDDNEVAGQAYLENMLKTKRYQEETWS